MSNDIKTLADAQPGGRVRLADQALSTTELRRNAHVLVLQELRGRFTDAGSPSRTAALDAAIAALSAQPSPGERRFHHVSQVAKHFGLAVTPEEMGEAIANAPSSRFSAESAAAAFANVQPSPGGHGDAITPAMVDAAASVLARWAGHDDGSRWVHEARDALEAALAARQPVGDQHPDDLAVDAFAAAMKAKMADARAKGRGGWEDPAQCTADDLSRMLRDHVEKGDPRDVANFCMMLHQRGESISARQPSKQPDSVALGEATEFCSEKGAMQPMGEPVAYTSETQLKAVRLCGDGIMSQRNAKWDIPLYLRPAQAVDLPYSLDADPAGIRARVCDVITGTLMIGAQGHTPPPAGHWAVPFWQAARHDAARSLNVALRLRELVVASKYMRDRVVETRGVKCMDDLDYAINEADKALIDSHAVGK